MNTDPEFTQSVLREDLMPFCRDEIRRLLVEKKTWEKAAEILKIVAEVCILISTIFSVIDVSGLYTSGNIFSIIFNSMSFVLKSLANKWSKQEYITNTKINMKLKAVGITDVIEDTSFLRKQDSIA